MARKEFVVANGACELRIRTGAVSGRSEQLYSLHCGCFAVRGAPAVRHGVIGIWGSLGGARGGCSEGAPAGRSGAASPPEGAGRTAPSFAVIRHESSMFGVTLERSLRRLAISILREVVSREELGRPSRPSEDSRQGTNSQLLLFMLLMRVVRRNSDKPMDIEDVR